MPKQRVNLNCKAHVYERESKTEFSVNPAGELFCILCHSVVNCDKKARVTQHQETAKHRRLLAATTSTGKRQTFIPQTKQDFKEKLVTAFLSADIPLYKLRNPKVTQLFTNLGQQVPSESSCRSHVATLAESQQEHIKDLLKNKTIFMVIDEIEHSKTKYFNVLVGDTAAPEQTYLVECSIVEAVNQQVVTQKIDDVLKRLKIERNNFVLLLSDAASYMTACKQALQLLYPRLFHVTCTAHLLHNCAEKVRSHFDDVDELISRTKAATVRNGTRRNQFHQIGSPPEPVLTRWGTWLNAAFYYADNFLEVHKIINNFQGGGVLVARAKQAVNSGSVAESLTKIKRDYKELPKLILKLESVKCTIFEAHADLHNLHLGQDSAGIAKYLTKRIAKNDDLDAIVTMKKEHISPGLYAELQSCQPTSAAVERSFSMLKKMLAKDRQFLPTNVAKYVSVYYNKF